MPATQFLDRAALARPGIFDGLGLVKNNDVPRRFLEPSQPNRHRVAGDDQVVAGQRRGRIFGRGGEFFIRGFRRMRIENRQRRRKLLDFGLPIGDERSGHNQQARHAAVGSFRRRPSAPERQQQGDDLNGFAQTHVVGQTRAQTELGS